MIHNCLHFFKKEPVFTIALLLAVISCFFVAPSLNYIEYLDLRVLSLLFCLMTVVGGVSALGVFRRLGGLLLQHVSSTRTLAGVLIALCFFSSMLITNDVALITFVPFTILTLELAGLTDLLIPLVVLETIAANLGSMLTPLGNPQNLYLYTISGMSVAEFILTLLPYTILAFLLLVLFLFSVRKETISGISESSEAENASLSRRRPLLALYAILFILCLLVVLHILPYPLVLALTALSVLFFDRHTLRNVDYTLLLTFVCFFVFIGNLKNIPVIHETLSGLIHGHEFIGGILASQCISNVPAAILLSGFTDRIAPLLVGVNLGGLGTLIASLASLISYKFYARTDHSKTGRYLAVFTLYNVLFLAVLSAFYFIVSSLFF